MHHASRVRVIASAMVQVPQPALAGLGITLPDPPSDPATLLDVFAGCMLADKLKTEYC